MQPQKSTSLNLENITSLRGVMWQLRPEDFRSTYQIHQQHQLPEIVARLLALRGINTQEVSQFLNPTLQKQLPDPSHLLDMDVAVDRVVRALQNNEKITIFGDYDVDGATSSALLIRFFRMIGGECDFYIPDREKEGYGPNIAAMDHLKSQGTKVVITVDCGATAFEPLAHAKANGLEVIVLDHHIGEANLPEATAVINPNRVDENSPYTYLAAVGVTFLFLVALNRKLRQLEFYQNKTAPNLLEFLDLVALGTVCDVVPLVGLNRTFVVQGLKVMKRQGNLGMKSLFEVTGLEEMPSTYHLGFILGPRINAGGRIGTASFGTTLLTTDNTKEARDLSETLHTLNLERQSIEREVLVEAFEMIREHKLDQDPIIVIAGDNWPSGVIGIVAGRLKDHYHRPVFMITFDDQGMGKGSGRSIPGVNLGAAIQQAKQLGLLVGGGGHAMAAGLTIGRDQLKPFQFFLSQKFQEITFDHKVDIDGIIAIEGIHMDLINHIEQLGPFGVKNPTPKFLIPNVRITYASVVGENHIKCTLASEAGKTLGAIAFRVAETPLGNTLMNKDGKLYHVIGTLKANHWQGTSKPQLILEDMVLAG